MRECGRGETDVNSEGLQRQRDLSSKVLTCSMRPMSDVQYTANGNSPAKAELNSQAELKS